MPARMSKVVTLCAAVTLAAGAPSAGAAGSGTGPVAVSNASAADSSVIATANVTAAPRQVCRATVRVAGRRASLGQLRTGPGGGGEWLWHLGNRAPAGRWSVSVACGVGKQSQATTTAFTTVGGPAAGRRVTLIAAGTRRAFASPTSAEKGVGLGAAGRNPYPAGQCTWWAWMKRPDLPWFSGESGNAKNWISSAQRAGIPTGTAPIAGAVVVFQPGQDYSGAYGHVAYVMSVSGNAITISEANFNGKPPGHVRTLSASGLHFVYGGPAGNGPGQPVPPPPVAPPPVSPQAVGAFPHRVYHTCANGACGLKLHTAPSLSSQTVGTLQDGAEVDITCQTVGDSVSGSDGSSSLVWDQLADGNYVADYYVDTPGSSGAFSSPIPRCSNSQTPEPTPTPTPTPNPTPAPMPVTYYDCGGTPNAVGHYVPAGKHWGNDFTAQGSMITGGRLLIGANTDGNNHQADIGIYTGGPNALSGELGHVTVNVSGYSGASFTFPQPIAVTPGQHLWLVALGIGDFTGYDQNNSGTDGCFIGHLDGTP